MIYLGIGSMIEKKEDGVRYLTSAEIDEFCNTQIEKTRDRMRELNDWRSRSLHVLRDVVVK